MLLEATPHPLGMYALLSDGRRAVNLVWASHVDPNANWLAWPGQRHRDHFTVCGGWPGVRTSTENARAVRRRDDRRAITPGARDRRRRSRRLRDWP